MDSSVFANVDALVATGRAVVAGGDDSIVPLVKDAIESNRSVSFYLTREQARAVKEWYWTPERIRKTGLALISDEEAERIRSELGIEGLSNFRFAPIQCECGHLYGAFDFLQQGVREHGVDTVTAVFHLKSSTFLQVNPTFVPVCPVCGRELKRQAELKDRAEPLGNGEYDCDEYGGCCYPF